MKFEKYFKDNENKNIDIYVDMDGVLAEYDIDNFDYNTIRPITTIIKRIKRLNDLDNININVLSICKTNRIMEEKYKWFKKHCNFINENQLIFISKEDIGNKKLSSKELKSNYLRANTNKNNLTVIIDDDNEILSYIKKHNNSIVLFQDSSLVD